ncbi:MAG TPA: hypothetical protein VLH19_01845 [Patescibacteria group bacterium]|nr:hypothetical protein [Patescibacteria group bacterium]
MKKKEFYRKLGMAAQQDEEFRRNAYRRINDAYKRIERIWPKMEYMTTGERREFLRSAKEIAEIKGLLDHVKP